MPEPDDPRWYMNCKDGKYCVTLGKIDVFLDKIVFDKNGPRWTNQRDIDGVVSRYNSAICTNLSATAAEDSILNAKMPPKHKRLNALPMKEVKALGPNVKGFDQPAPGLYVSKESNSIFIPGY